MPVTVADILTDAQVVHLGDEQAEVFDTTYLLGFFANAYRMAIKDARLQSSRIVKRKIFTRLAANSASIIVPNSAKLQGLGTSLIRLAMRAEASFVSIASVSVSSGIPTYTTGSAHGRSVGEQVQVMGIESGLGGANVESLVTATPSGTQLTLENPVTGTGPVAGSGMGISYGTAAWYDLSETSHKVPGQLEYEFTNGMYKTQPAGTARQVLFEYWLEPNSRTFISGDLVEEERLRDLLALKVALLAGHKKIADRHYSTLEQNYLTERRELKMSLVKDQQREFMRPIPHHTVLRQRGVRRF